VPGIGGRAAQVPGAVGGIAVPGQRILLVITAVAAAAGCPVRAGAVLPALGGSGLVFGAGTGRPGLGGQELRRDRRVGVLLAGRPGQLLAGDDPGLRVRGDMGAVPVAARLGGLAGVPGICVG
jgi:hypothetical protein